MPRKTNHLYIKVKAGPNIDSLSVGEFQWMPSDCETDYWKLCDGRTMWIMDWPELFREIGTLHGQGIPGMTFFLPDQDKIKDFLHEVAV